MSTIVVLVLFVLLLILITRLFKRNQKKEFRILLIGVGLLIFLILLWMAFMVIYVGQKMKNF